MYIYTVLVYLYNFIRHNTFFRNVTTRKIVKKYIWRRSQILLYFVHIYSYIFALDSIYTSNNFFSPLIVRLRPYRSRSSYYSCCSFPYVLYPGCIIQLQQNNWTNVVGKIVSAAGKLILRALICGNCSRIRPR